MYMYHQHIHVDYMCNGAVLLLQPVALSQMHIMLNIIWRVKWNLLQQQSCYCRKIWYIVPVYIVKCHLLHFVYRSASLQERPWNIHISVSDIIKMHLKILFENTSYMYEKYKKQRIGSSSMSILAAMYFIVENICWHFIQKTMADTANITCNIYIYTSSF